MKIDRYVRHKEPNYSYFHGCGVAANTPAAQKKKMKPLICQEPYLNEDIYHLIFYLLYIIKFKQPWQLRQHFHIEQDQSPST